MTNLLPLWRVESNTTQGGEVERERGGDEIALGPSKITGLSMSQAIHSVQPGAGEML